MKNIILIVALFPVVAFSITAPIGKTTCNGWINFATESQKQDRTVYVMDNAKNANFPPSLTRGDIESYCSDESKTGATMDDVIKYIDQVEEP
jgi:hypothetical protein